MNTVPALFVARNLQSRPFIHCPDVPWRLPPSDIDIALRPRLNRNVHRFDFSRGGSSSVVIVLSPACVRGLSGLPTVIQSESQRSEPVTTPTSTATGTGLVESRCSAELEQCSRCYDAAITACTACSVLGLAATNLPHICAKFRLSWCTVSSLLSPCWAFEQCLALFWGFFFAKPSAYSSEWGCE